MNYKIKEILILGSGTSTGIPMIGCHCLVCTSNNPKDQRLRSSLLITSTEGKKILVDTSPDLRQQCLKNQIEWLDAVIITHDHADHLHGIDELRALTFKRKAKGLGPLKIYSSKECAQSMIQRFPYIFDPHFFSTKKVLGGGIPYLELIPLEMGPTLIEGLPFLFFHCPHGHGQSMSFRCSSFVYVIDCHIIPETIMGELDKAHLLIIDCLQRGPHDTHLTMWQTFEYIRRIGPKRAGMIHMNHDLSHLFLENALKEKLGDLPIDCFVCHDNLNLIF